MKKYLILIFVALAAVFQSCDNNDDLWDAIDDLKSRVQALETQVDALNGNIEALQKLYGGATISNEANIAMKRAFFIRKLLRKLRAVTIILSAARIKTMENSNYAIHCQSGGGIYAFYITVGDIAVNQADVRHARQHYICDVFQATGGLIFRIMDGVAFSDKLH